MSRNSAVWKYFARLTRFFVITKAPELDAQFAEMVRKNNAVKSELKTQMEKLDQCQPFVAVSVESQLKHLLQDLDALTEGLHYMQLRIHNNNTGIAAQYFDEDFWPLTVKVSKQYELATGKAGNWGRDSERLAVLCAQQAQRLRERRTRGVFDFIGRFFSGQKQIQALTLKDRKYCNDCGEPMAPCDECGALIKPCFLKMGMKHLC